MKEKKRLRLIGKLLSVDIEKRPAYLMGMLDYIELTGSEKESDFLVDLHNYLTEHSYFNSIIMEYATSYA